jgi:hypothetical protein
MNSSIQEFNPGKGTTLGKTYEVTKGKIIYDNGQPSHRSYENLKDLNSLNTAKFVEYKKRGRPKKNKE